MILGVVTHDDFALGWLVVASSTVQLPFMVEKVYSWGKGDLISFLFKGAKRSTL
jgi:hypothetical protein